MRTRALLLLLLVPGFAWAGFSDGVSDDRLRLPSGPGSLEGVGANVVINPNMGVMENQVPFSLPAGFPGATPSLGLGYSSGSGSSEVGVGWSLSQPSVERMTARGLPRYTAVDSFVADGGSELVQVDIQGAANIYRNRFEGGFVRWLWHSPGANGYWEAQYPDGSRGFFGADHKGTLVPEANVYGSGGGTFRYQLVEQLDVFGHIVRYDYTKSATSGYALLSRISWLFYDATNARYTVELAYEGRDDKISDATSGVEIVLDRRLHSVDVLYHGAAGVDRVRGYLLTYSPTAWLSQLVQVQQFGLGDTGDTMPYPIVHSFDYSQTLGATTGQSLVAISDPLNGGAVSAGSATLIDINGDGLPDVIDASAPGKHRIWLSQLASDGTHHLVGPTDSAVGDGTNFPLGTQQVTPLDVNGDGYTDLINASSAKVLINNGSGDWAPQMQSLLPGALDLSQVSTLRFYDYDGDKRIDVLQTPDATTTNVFRNNGDGSFTKIPVMPLGISFANEKNAQLADINGDGLLDVVLVESNGGGQILYRINLGWGNWSSDGPVNGWRSAGFAVTDVQLPNVLIEDINGDSLRDILLVEQSSVTYMLNRNGSSFDLPRTITSTAGGVSLPERTVGTTVVTADMNGNGTTDVVWIDMSGKVTYLDLFAVRPNLLTHIENGIGRVTDITYTSTVMEMARARESGSPWKYRVPFAMTVVDKVDEWDRLTNLHEVTSYNYNDGYYDGTEKQYRGHAHVEQSLIGDATQEDGLVVSDFDVGATDVYMHGRLLHESTTSGMRLLSESAHTYDRCAVELETSVTPSYPVVNICETKVVNTLWEGTKTPVTTEVDTAYDGFGNVTKESNLGVIGGCNATCTRPGDAFGEPCGQGCSGDESYSETQYVPRAKTNGAWIVHAPYRHVTYGNPGGAQTELLTYYDTVDGMPFLGRAGELTLGLVTRTTLAVGGGAAPLPVSRVLYNADGQIVASLDPNGTPGDMSSHLKTFGYDSDGTRLVSIGAVLKDHTLERKVRYDEHFNKPISSTDWMTVAGSKSSGENASAYEYDSFGRLIAIHEPDPTTGLPAAMPTKWFTYDLKSPASRVITHSSLGGEGVRCADGRGRQYQSRARAAEGSYLVTGFTVFNTRGAVVQTYQPYSSGSDDCDAAPPMGTLATKIRYDAAHRPIETTLPDDALYQTPSVLKTVYLPLETQAFDALDNDMTSPFANTPTIHRVDGLGRTIALGRTLTAGAPAAFTTVLYDELGHTRGYVDAAGNVKTQQYDLAGRLVEIDDPNSGKTTLAYDAASQLTAITDARGATVRKSYDDMNRPLASWDDADHDGTVVTALYDGDPGCPLCSNTAGRFVGSVYPGGKDSRGYDVRGRLIYSARSLEGVTFETGSAYDDDDRAVSTTFPDGRTMAYHYDSAARPLGIDGVIDNIAYDARGLMTQTSYSNGTSMTRTYDDLMRPVADAWTAPDGPAQSLSYSRDRMGNLLAVTDDMPDGKLGAGYSYDAWYRTVGVTLPDEKLDYRFDAVDNLTSAISSLAEKSAAHVGDYQYGSAGPNAVTQAGALAVAYDQAGHVTKRGTLTHTWDAFGRLSGASLPDGDAIYRFGPAQDRAVAIEPHGVTYYVSGAFEVQDGLGVTYVRIGQSRVARLVSPDFAAKVYTDVAPLDGPDGKITAGDAWVANAGLVSMSTSPADRLLLSSARRILYETLPTSTWFGHDQLGSTTLETDDQGAVVGRRGYYPFGAERFSSGDADRYGFTGQETDGTGMLHFSFRQLDPALGRWASADPAFQVAAAERLGAFGESTTAYAYVGNNPANGVDPTGLGREALMKEIRAADKSPHKAKLQTAGRLDAIRTMFHAAGDIHHDALEMDENGREAAKCCALGLGLATMAVTARPHMNLGGRELLHSMVEGLDTGHDVAEMFAHPLEHLFTKGARNAEKNAREMFTEAQGHMAKLVRLTDAAEKRKAENYRLIADREADRLADRRVEAREDGLQIFIEHADSSVTEFRIGITVRPDAPQ